MTHKEWWRVFGSNYVGRRTLTDEDRSAAAWDAAMEVVAGIAEDCIANGVVVLSAGEVAAAIRQRKSGGTGA